MSASKKLLSLNTPLSDLQDEVGFILHELEGGRKVSRQYLAELLINAVTQAENAQEQTLDGIVERIAATNGLPPDDVVSVLEALAGFNSPERRKKALRYLRTLLPDILADLEIETAFEHEEAE